VCGGKCLAAAHLHFGMFFLTFPFSFPFLRRCVGLVVAVDIVAVVSSTAAAAQKKTHFKT